jgi:hypothetical protein
MAIPVGGNHSMNTNFNKLFDHDKITAAGKALVSDQLKLLEEASKSVSAEIEYFTEFVGTLGSLKMGAEITNAAISYWSNAGLRSLALVGKAKESFEKTAKPFA